MEERHRKSEKEIWVYDKDKLYLAKKEGYNCEVIWETDNKKKITL